MSIKSKVLAGAAALSVASGLGVVAASSAHATTPSCGSCISISSVNNGGVFDAFKRGHTAGTQVTLWGNSNSDPATDFRVYEAGTVHEFYKAGLMSWAMDHYGPRDEAYEIEYTPYGVDSGLCVGVPSKAVNGRWVRLEPCGVSAATTWVVVNDSATWTSNGVENAELANGSTTNFFRPEVLTENGATLFTYQQDGDNGVIYDTQLFNATNA